MCLEIYELDPPFSSWVSMASSFEKVKLDLLINIDMLLMVEKGIRGGICHSIYRYPKANDMKVYDINKESSYIRYWEVNNLYGSGISKKLPINNFEWIKDEDFMKIYNGVDDEGYFLEVNLEKLHEIHNNLPFLPERSKSPKVIYMIKLKMLFT